MQIQRINTVNTTNTNYKKNPNFGLNSISTYRLPKSDKVLINEIIPEALKIGDKATKAVISIIAKKGKEFPGVCFIKYRKFRRLDSHGDIIRDGLTETEKYRGDFALPEIQKPSNAEEWLKFLRKAWDETFGNKAYIDPTK